MNRCIYILAIALFSLFPPSLKSQQQDKGGKKISNSNAIVIPMTYRSGAGPVIAIKVNGKGPYRFLFDTGSPGLLKLDETLFKELGLTVTDSVLAGDGSGQNTQTFPLTSVNSIDIGGHIVKNMPAMVRNYNTRIGIDSIDGVIGMDAFSNVLVEFNFENDQLIISNDKLDPTDNHTVRLVNSRGVPGISMEIAGTPTDVIFDTGNMGGLTLHSSDVTAAIMVGQPRVIGTAKTVSNSFEIKEVQLNQNIRFAGLEFEKPVIVLNDLLRQANAGIRFLKQMNITIDSRNGLVKCIRYEKRKTAAAVATGNEYMGQYGDRTITLGNDDNLYIQRPGGMLLKMIARKKDEYGLDAVPGAIIVFESDESNNIIGLRVSRGDGQWETAKKK